MINAQKMILASIILMVMIFQYSKAAPTLPYHTMEVFGNASLGYYYVTLYYGSPPQPQTVILDTGSSLLTTPCSKCQQCGNNHINSYFDISKSKTIKFVTCGSKSDLCKNSCKINSQLSDPCKFSSFYSQGSSYEGIFLQDYIQLEQNTKDEGVRIQFGCTTKETNLFYTQKANGILGLAPKRSLIFQKLTQTHAIFTGQKMQFSLCLSSNGGFLNVGAINPLYHTQPPIIAKIKPEKQLYTIEEVKQFKLGSFTVHHQGLNLGAYGVFIDSGSTISYLPRQQYNGLITELNRLCSQHKYCSAYEKSTIMHSYQFKSQVNDLNVDKLQQLLLTIFPPLIMDISGQNLHWSPLEYFFLRDQNKLIISLGIQGFDRFLLGANFIVNKDILFNLQKNILQIYPQSNCKLNNKSQDHKNNRINHFPFPSLLKKNNNIKNIIGDSKP